MIHQHHKTVHKELHVHALDMESFERMHRDPQKRRVIKEIFADDD